jgi:hypothetical protein
MRLVELGRHPATIDLTKVDWSAEPSALAAIDHSREFRASVEIAFKQIAPKEAEPHVLRHAKRAIAHHIYGPIVAELVPLVNDMRRRGPDMWPMAERIEALIQDMEGRTE